MTLYKYANNRETTPRPRKIDDLEIMDIEDQNEPIVTNDEKKDPELGTIRAANKIYSKYKVGNDLVIQGIKYILYKFSVANS